MTGKRWRTPVVSAVLAAGLSAPVWAGSAALPAAPAKPAQVNSRAGLVEPVLHVAQAGPQPSIALTLDACMGGFDRRIYDVLVAKHIKATIFATSRWIRANPQALADLLQHRDLFDIEDHGAEHVPAVLGYMQVFGIRSAGTLQAVMDEVDGGARSVTESTGKAPAWYRDATAFYTPSVIGEIEAHGYRIAGFSLNADFGASLPGPAVAQRILGAHGGDVIIAHINQPRRSSGAGVAAAISQLADRHYNFVWLGGSAAAPPAPKS